MADFRQLRVHRHRNAAAGHGLPVAAGGGDGALCCFDVGTVLLPLSASFADTSCTVRGADAVPPASVCRASPAGGPSIGTPGADSYPWCSCSVGDSTGSAVLPAAGSVAATVAAAGSETRPAARTSKPVTDAIERVKERIEFLIETDPPAETPSEQRTRCVPSAAADAESGYSRHRRTAAGISAVFANDLRSIGAPIQGGLVSALGGP